MTTTITATNVNTGADGYDVTPTSDTDTDLVTLAVTGTPKLSWDESQDSFKFNKAIDIGPGIDSTLWPRWSVHKNGSGQGSVGTSTTLITWSTALFDEGASVDLVSTYDFTVPTNADGIYLISAALLYGVIADANDLRVEVILNGSTTSAIGVTVASGTASQAATVCTIQKLTAGDIITINGKNATSTDTVSGSSNFTWWAGCRIA